MHEGAIASVACGQGMFTFNPFTGVVIETCHIDMPDDVKPVKIDCEEYADYHKGIRLTPGVIYDILDLSYWTRTNYVDACVSEFRDKLTEANIEQAYSYMTLTDQESDLKISALISRVASERDE